MRIGKVGGATGTLSCDDSFMNPRVRFPACESRGARGASP